jgi:hypothetical protein
MLFDGGLWVRDSDLCRGASTWLVLVEGTESAGEGCCLLVLVSLSETVGLVPQ